MKRRAFLSLFGVALAAWPLRARSAAGKRPVVGFLVPGTQASYSQWLNGFVQRIRELGWRDSDNVEIIYRATDGVKERYAEIAAEFVKLKVDVIVTSGSEGVVAAKQATSAIPIVFAATADPVAIGLVESLAHPGGNVTGLSAESTDYAGKEVELLGELVPGLHRLAILTNADSPGMMAETGKVQAAARAAGLDVVTLAVRRAEEITAAFDGLKNKADAIYCVPGPLTGENLYALLRWRSRQSCRRFTAPGIMSTPEALSPTGRTSPIYSGAPPILSTRFFAARGRPIFPSSNRPNSCSLSI